MREKISYKTEYSSWLKRKNNPARWDQKEIPWISLSLSTNHKPTEQTSYNPHFCVVNWLPLNSKFIHHWLALWNWMLAVNTALLETGTKLRFVSRGCRRDVTGVFFPCFHCASSVPRTWLTVACVGHSGHLFTNKFYWQKDPCLPNSVHSAACQPCLTSCEPALTQGNKANSSI